MKRQLLLAASLVLMTASVTATGFNLEPGTYENSLVAGENYTQEIGITWTGETTVVGEVNPVIEAENTDSEGINVSYSSDILILEPGVEKTVIMTVQTPVNLASDNYTIKTNVSTEYPIEYKSSGGGSSDDSDSGGSEVIYRNETETVYQNVTDGSLNKSQEEDILNRLDNLEKEDKQQSEIINDLVKDLSSSQTEASKFEKKYDQIKWVTGTLAALLLVLAVLVGKMMFGERIMEKVQKVK